MDAYRRLRPGVAEILWCCEMDAQSVQEPTHRANLCASILDTGLADFPVRDNPRICE